MMKKVCIAMSGGVDSSTTAFLLKEAGYDVFGVFMKLWDSEKSERGCCGLSDSIDALRVAEQLKIPFYVLNLKEEFKTYVIDYFIDEYKKGRTPNPCIKCNLFLKFKILLDKALTLGSDYLATGHYARNVLVNDKNFLYKGIDGNKDQSYFLFNIPQARLGKILFPLGDFKKEEVRIIAEKANLRTAKKKESQEVCFIENDYRDFLMSAGIKGKEGDVLDINGKRIGKHKGYFYYTIGQRGGLNISMGYPIYVIDIVPQKNIVVADREEYLFKKELTISDINLFDDIDEEKFYTVKIRYRHKGERAKIKKIGEKLKIIFESPQRAITPGQAGVIYDEDKVVGGGWIE
ncbi:MAG: tRNA 2-thiouridine(34) synthase MnmA [Proteobacteria bacterium]|nr:tRNA 2-thiouridine(34) synthase MnmA [Pseudomonadota bacterium]